MKFFRNYFLWMLLLGSIGLWVYTDINRKGPCEAPLKYSLGAYDERFGISRSEFKSAIDEAASIWETSSGKNLFEYEPDPKPVTPFYTYFGRLFVRKDIPVNLEYDERQELSLARRELVTEVNEQRENADYIRSQISNLQADYARSVREYESLVSRYRKHQTTYAAVEATRQEVNYLADQINSLVKKYNSLVGELNSVVKTINQTAGLEFEEGQYVADEKGERITIFEFSDRATLVRVLAHEFGHALGLEHNDNPDSIMYYLNDSGNMEPTKDDLADLSLICKGE